MGTIDITEWNEDGDYPVQSFNTETMTRVQIHSSPQQRTSASSPSISSLVRILKQTFLPIGYPKSTPPDYIDYQFWNLLQDLCSYLRGIMATRAVLIGMGVGRSEVTAYQATIQWLLRDGAGLIGGLMFTSLSSYNFGQNVKIWRLFADMINNVGITLDMLAPMLSYHTCALVLCVASVCKALCGIAAGATGAAINAHFGSLYNNNADIMAKNGAQHNIVTLIGLCTSIWLAKAADEASASIIWAIYIILTAIHIYSNYRAMRVLSLRSINVVRFELLIDRFLSSAPLTSFLHDIHLNKTQIPVSLFDEVTQWLSIPSNRNQFTPASIAKSEPILRLILPISLRGRNNNNFNKQRCEVHQWSSFSEILDKSSKDLSAVQVQLRNQIEKPYFIIRLPNHKCSTDSLQIHICISKGASMENIAKAFFEAELWNYLKDEDMVRQLVEGLFPIFWELLKENTWIVDNMLLKPFGARLVEISKTESKKVK